MTKDTRPTPLSQFDDTIDPFTGERLLSRPEMEVLAQAVQNEKAQAETTKAHVRRLRDEGWKTDTEVSRLTGYSKRQIRLALTHYAPQNGQYIYRYYGQGGGTHYLLPPAYAAELIDASARERALRQQGYKTAAETRALTGMAETAFYRAVNSIQPEKIYFADGTEAPAEHPQAIQGAKLVWREPERRLVMLHPAFVAHLIGQQATRADDDAVAHTLRAQGYQTCADAAAVIGMPVESLRRRVQQIQADQDYLLTGLPPTGVAGETTIRGRLLAWLHPTLSAYLLHPEYVAALKHVEQQRREHVAQGYLTFNEAMDISGVTRSAIARRVQNFSPEAYYEVADGTNAPPLKGSEVRWINPYNMKENLIHPRLVQAWKHAEEIYQTLLSKGYKTPQEAATIAHIGVSDVIQRLDRVQADGHYTPAGQPLAAATTSSVLGKDLAWRHPYARSVLVSPPLCEAWAQAAQAVHHEAALKAQGYQSIPDVSRATGIDTDTLTLRLRTYLPDTRYPASGERREPHPQEPTLLGKELYWKGEHGCSSTYVHPAFMQGMVQEARKQQTLIQQGYRTIKQAAAYTGYSQSGLTQKIPASPPDAAAEGTAPVYKSPYGRAGILLPPHLVEQWKMQREATLAEKSTDAPVANDDMAPLTGINNTGPASYPISHQGTLAPAMLLHGAKMNKR